MLVVLVIHPQVGVALKRDITREMSEVINFLILKFQDLKGSNLFTPPVGHQVNGTRMGARERGDLISGGERGVIRIPDQKQNTSNYYSSLSFKFIPT